jgi:hypothetical protein
MHPMSEPARAVRSDVLAPPRVKPVSVVDRPRHDEYAWIREHGPEYAGQWVALDGRRLLAAAAKLNDLLRQLGPQGRQRDPLFHRIDVE